MTVARIVGIGIVLIGFAAASELNSAHARIFMVQNSSRPNDVQVQHAVMQALQVSPLTASSFIVVHVNHGAVTLEGAAVSSLARREASRLAEPVVGVTEIRNRLSVVETLAAEIPTSP